MTGSRKRQLAAAALLVLAPAVLGACGKKGDPEVPPGREREFVYPRTYPDPDLVVPRTAGPTRVEDRPKPGPSIFSKGRTTTRVYGPVTTD